MYGSSSKQVVGAAPNNHFDSCGISHDSIHAAKSVLVAIDNCEQEISVLEVLKTTAEEALQAQKDVHRKAGKQLDNELWLRVVEVLSPDASHLENRRVHVRVECNGKTVRTTAKPGSVHIVWDESFSFPATTGSNGGAEHSFHVSVCTEGEGHLCGCILPSLKQHGQEAHHQWCDLEPGRMRVKLTTQKVHSQSELIRSHLDQFSSRLREARSKLLENQKHLVQIIPKRGHSYQKHAGEHQACEQGNSYIPL